MSLIVDWMAAGAETPSAQGSQSGTEEESQDQHQNQEQNQTRSQSPHPVCAKNAQTRVGHPLCGDSELLQQYREEDWERERERRIYRGRTVAMLRRYLRYSMETGRLPSLLGREFFRSKVTSYTVVTFEDRVIFVHDMERCLEKLDEFSRQIIARHILQEHDRWATARLLNCNEKTIRRLTPIVLDVLSEILLDVGLLERIEHREKSCQGGAEAQNFVSACEHEKNKF